MQLIITFVMIQQDNDPVRLLVTFSSDVDLDQIISSLNENYHFVQRIVKHGKSELLVSFDSMSQLLEIDFVKQFGALSTKVRNSHSFCKEMNDENHISTEDVSGTDITFHDQRDISGNIINNSKQLAYRQRLTSVDNCVSQQEETINNLALFEDNISLLQGEKQQIKCQDQFEKTDEHFQQKNCVEKENIWGPIVNGIVLTSLLVGGVKAIKFFLG